MVASIRSSGKGRGSSTYTNDNRVEVNVSSPGTDRPPRASLHPFLSFITMLAATACAGPESAASGGSIEADHFVPSRPETVIKEREGIGISW